MAKDFANRFKKTLKKYQPSSDGLVGAVLSVKPLRVSCHNGQWLLEGDDLQISNHVTLHVGDDVVLSGQDPFNIVSVLSDADADAYEPPDTSYDDTELRRLIAGKQDQGDYALRKELPVIPTKISAFTNDAGYLTMHQDLSRYALKSELPTVPTKISAFTNDTGYITKNVTGDMSVTGALTVTGVTKINSTFSVQGVLWNPISSTGNDTTANWRALGNSVLWYNTAGCLYSQPSTYGYLLNITGAGNDVHQMWFTQSTGNILHRGGNGSGWNGNGATTGTWRTIIDSSNIGSYANLYTLPTAAPGTKGGIQMLHGTKSDVSVAANSYTDAAITFSTAFPGTPGVVVSRHAASSASTNVASSANRTIVTHSVTATGFKVRCYNNTSASWASTFRWLAIYRG
ncbi:MAG: hypothetical protein Q4F79_07410 [Eubacteriales bacterium]|nr:hypothetical protein [Eubacteriales bacterium]